MLCCEPPSQTLLPTCRTACWYFAEPVVLCVGFQCGVTCAAPVAVLIAAPRSALAELEVVKYPEK